MIDFSDGGAFPEVHALQYPLGLGVTCTKPYVSHATVAPSHLSTDVPATLAEIEQRTGLAIEARVNEARLSKRDLEEMAPSTRLRQTKNDKRLAAFSTEVAAPSVVTAITPAEVLREVTSSKKEKVQAFHVPQCVSAWKNSGRSVVLADVREAADASRSDRLAVPLAREHIETAMALRQSFKQLEEANRIKEAAQRDEEHRKQELLEKDELRKANALLREQQEREAALARTESREERAQRIAAQREMHQRDKEAELRLRRLQRAADRLNIPLEDMMKDARLLKAAEEGAPSKQLPHGGSTNTVEAMYDSRIAHTTRQHERTAADGTGLGDEYGSVVAGRVIRDVGYLSNKRIAEEQARLDEAEQRAKNVPNLEGVDALSDDENDVFKIDRLVRQGKRPRHES